MASRQRSKRSASLGVRDTNQNHSKVSPPTCQNGHHQKVYRKQKWVRMWEKGTLVHCWWECKLEQPLWEKSTEASQNSEDRTMAWPGDSAPGCVSGKNKHQFEKKDTCIPVFTAALFTIAEIQKHPKCPSTSGWISTWGAHACGGILRSHQKEWDNAICSNMEGIMLSEIRKRRRNTVKSWEIPQSSERNKKEAGSKKQRTHWWSLVGVGSARCRTGSKMNPTARGTQPVFYDN